MAHEDSSMPDPEEGMASPTLLQKEANRINSCIKQEPVDNCTSADDDENVILDNKDTAYDEGKNKERFELLSENKIDTRTLKQEVDFETQGCDLLKEESDSQTEECVQPSRPVETNNYGGLTKNRSRRKGLDELQGDSVTELDGSIQVKAHVNFCLYCDKNITTKAAMHLLSQHTYEKEVEKINELPPNSKGRMSLWRILLNAGNYKHNVKVLENGYGTFVTKSRPKYNSPEYSLFDFKACEQCLIFLPKNALKKHKQRHCPFQNKEFVNSLLPGAASYGTDTMLVHSGNMKCDEGEQVIIKCEPLDPGDSTDHSLHQENPENYLDVKPSTSSGGTTSMSKQEIFAPKPKKRFGNRKKVIVSCSDGLDTSVLFPESEHLIPEFKELIVTRMAKDVVTYIVRNDMVILLYGQEIYNRRTNFRSISVKMREMARLLVCARDIDPDVGIFQDLLTPTKFYNVVLTATKSLCKYDVEKKTFVNPSLARDIGVSLQNCAKNAINFLLEKDSEPAKLAHAFLVLCHDEWDNEIAANAVNNLNENRQKVAESLPLTENIMKLLDYLRWQGSLRLESLENRFRDHDFDDMYRLTDDSFDALNRLTMCYYLLLNKHRGSKAPTVTVKDYETKLDKGTGVKNDNESFSPVEKILATVFRRFEIVGYDGGMVPVFLTPDLEKSLDFLLKLRSCAEINQQNTYLFPSANAESLLHVNAYNALKKFAIDAQISDPELVTSSRNRYEVAIISQLLNMTEQDLETVAKHIGHDIDLEKAKTVPDRTLQIAQMGKLLIAYNSGKHAQYKGMTVDEIPLDNEGQIVAEDTDIDTDGGQASTSSRKGEVTMKGTVRKFHKLSMEQSLLLKDVFHDNIQNEKGLKKWECEEARETYPILANLTWKKVKNAIHSFITSVRIKRRKREAASESSVKTSQDA